MIKKNLILILMISLFVIIFFNTSTEAYKLTGYHLNKSEQLLYYVHVDFSSTTFTHMNNALYKWYQASGHNLMKRDPNIRHSVADFGTPNSNDGFNLVYKMAAGSGNYLARNVWYANKTTKIISQSDINFNADKKFANSAQAYSYDAYSVFLHETGHTIGLDDLTSSTDDAVMYGDWSFRYNTISYRTLRQDDINGALSIYS